MPKTFTLDSDIIRAAESAINAGKLAKDFGAAVEEGLRLMLRSEGFPETLSAEEMAIRLSVKLEDIKR